MKKYKSELMVFLTIVLLIVLSLTSTTISKPNDSQYVASLANPRIIIEKMAWNGTDWADYAEVEETVFDLTGSDNATVNVIPDEEPELQIGIEEAFFVGKLSAFVKNNRETNMSDVNWEITIKNTGFFKKINSTTEGTIELLESKEKVTLKTETIQGFGKINVVFRVTVPELEPVTITKTGVVIGRAIILFPPK